MRWPWSGREALAQAAQHVQPPTVSPAGWASLPPLQRQVGGLEPTSALRTFPTGLAAWRSPALMGPIQREVGDVRPVASRTYRPQTLSKAAPTPALPVLARVAGPPTTRYAGPVLVARTSPSGSESAELPRASLTRAGSGHLPVVQLVAASPDDVEEPARADEPAGVETSPDRAWKADEDPTAPREAAPAVLTNGSAADSTSAAPVTPDQVVMRDSVGPSPSDLDEPGARDLGPPLPLVGGPSSVVHTDHTVVDIPAPAGFVPPSTRPAAPRGERTAAAPIQRSTAAATSRPRLGLGAPLDAALDGPRRVSTQAPMPMVQRRADPGGADTATPPAAGRAQDSAAEFPSPEGPSSAAVRNSTVPNKTVPNNTDRPSSPSGSGQTPAETGAEGAGDVGPLDVSPSLGIAAALPPEAPADLPLPLSRSAARVHEWDAPSTDPDPLALEPTGTPTPTGPPQPADFRQPADSPHDDLAPDSPHGDLAPDSPAPTAQRSEAGGESGWPGAPALPLAFPKSGAGAAVPGRAGRSAERSGGLVVARWAADLPQATHLSALRRQRSSPTLRQTPDAGDRPATSTPGAGVRTAQRLLADLPTTTATPVVSRWRPAMLSATPWLSPTSPTHSRLAEAVRPSRLGPALGAAGALAMPLAPASAPVTPTVAEVVRHEVSDTAPDLAQASGLAGAAATVVGGPPSGIPALAGAGAMPASPGAPEALSGRPAATAQELEDLARRLFDPLAARLRADLLLDRERRGQRTDAW